MMDMPTRNLEEAPEKSETGLSNAELHLTYRVANAPLNRFPFPHCYIPNVFPEDVYANMQRQLPDPEAMIPIGQARGTKGSKERFVLPFKSEALNTLPEPRKIFWSDFAGWMLSGRLQQVMMSKFAQFVEARFPDATNIEFFTDAMLVQDITDYTIGPHCDSPGKVITTLFYLPADNSQAHLGTSIYTPKDPTFKCATGAHHPADKFNRVVTMPFLPNSVFAFVRSDDSFHGVEPVGDPDCRRWLLIFTIYARRRP